MPIEMGKASSGEAHSKQPTTFGDLPAEIRNMIWKAVLVPRVIILKPKDRTTETESPTEVDFNKVPGMLSANRESRLIALNHYDQRFTLAFSKQVPTQPDGSTSRLLCRIPVIMSTLDEIAFSRSQIRTQFTDDDELRLSIDTPAGAPYPHIERFSLLGDSLMRHGIDTEHLARLLNPEGPDYEFNNIFSCRSVKWRPFSQCPKLGLSDQYPEGVESAIFEFESFPGMGLNEWLRFGFSIGCRNEMPVSFMELGWIDAYIFVLA